MVVEEEKTKPVVAVTKGKTKSDDSTVETALGKKIYAKKTLSNLTGEKPKSAGVVDVVFVIDTTGIILL
jgi:hypothetical protein